MASEGLGLGGPDGPAPGLAYKHQTSTDQGPDFDLRPAGEGCPNRCGMVWFDLLTGEIRPARCGRLSCAYCVTRNAWRRAAAIAFSRPEREIRISLVADEGESDPWRTARTRINRTREYLKRFGQDPGEWVSHVESNPRLTGFHAHVWQHGPVKLDKDALDQAAFRAGAGLTRVRKVRSEVGVASYGLKGVGSMGYGLKGADGDPMEYLRLNGNRLTHQSRGFFRSPVGATLPVRGAERAALALVVGGGEGRWTLATERGARTLASLRPRRTTGPA